MALDASKEERGVFQLVGRSTVNGRLDNCRRYTVTAKDYVVVLNSSIHAIADPMVSKLSFNVFGRSGFRGVSRVQGPSFARGSGQEGGI